MKRLLTLLLTLLTGIVFYTPVQAQSYPVQATMQLTPPYSLYLADYTAPGSNRIMVNVLLKDLTRSDLQARLKLTIEGVGISITTKPTYRPQPLYLQGGLPVMLTEVDLAPYFNPENLVFQGVSKNSILKGGALPEGLYRVCVEVLDYNLGAQVSNRACASAWMVLNDPPIINLPFQNEKLRAQEPQNIVFQWTPRHTGSPNAAFSTEYEFELVELWQPNINPNHAIQSTPPIYQTTTFSTTLIYGPAETPLVPGRKYAFRVKAKAMTGVEELDLFKNHGYSEVFTFTYGDACIAPAVISATTVSSSRVQVTWDTEPVHTEFIVGHRKQGNDQWQEQRTYLNEVTISGLQPESTYEFRVRSICGSINGKDTETVTATTSEEPVTNFTCGAGPGEYELDNQEPLLELKPGDIFKAGDIEVRAFDIQGSNGIYTGIGHAKMPWLRHVSLRVEFSSIFINSDYQMLRGVVKTIFNPDSKLVVDLDGNDELSGDENSDDEASEDTDVEINYDGEISDVHIDTETGEIIVTDEDGTQTAYPVETDEKTGETKSVKVVDSSGDSWIVKDGKVTKGSSGQDIPNPDNLSPDQLDLMLSIQDKIVKAVIGEFNDAIDAWLEVNGKGPLDENELMAILEGLPSCMPEVEEDLVNIQEGVLPEMDENARSYVNKIRSNENARIFFDDLASNFSSPEVVDLSSLSDEDHNRTWNEVCNVMPEYTSVHIGVSLIPDYLWNDNGTSLGTATVTFVSPAGTLVPVKVTARNFVFAHGVKNVAESDIVTGTLLGFTIGKTRYSYNPQAGTFTGYASNGATYTYSPKDDDEKSRVTDKAIMVLPCDGGIGFYQFDVAGGILDAGNSNPILDEAKFPIRLFDGNPLLQSKIYTIEEFETLTEGGSNRFHVTDHEMAMVAPHCGKPEVLPVLKLAQLRNAYPTLFSHFESGIYNLGALAVNMEFKEFFRKINSQKGELNSYDFQCFYTNSFKEYIELRQGPAKDMLELLSPDMSSADFNLMLTAFGAEDYERLSIDQRIMMLQIATRGTIALGLENAVKNTIVYTPEKDWNSMLNALASRDDGSGEESLLESLCKDFTGLDGAEFTETIGTLTAWISSKKTVPSTFDYKYALENRKGIPFKPGLWLGDALQEHFNDQGEVVLKAREQFTTREITVTSHPYDYVVVQLKENFSMGGTTLPEGTEIKVPAIYAYMLFNNENTARLIKTGRVTLDIAFFAVGVGELSAALRAGATLNKWRVCKSLIDVGFTVTDFTIFNVLGDELQATPEGQAILEAWNELTIYYGVAAVSEMVIRNALNKLKHNVDVVVNRGRFVDETGSTTRTLNGEEKTKLVRLYEDFELKTGFKAVGSAEAGIDGISANLRRYLDELPESEANLFWDEVYDTDIWNNLIKNSDDQVSLFKAWKTIKYCGDPTLAAKATNKTEIELVASKLDEVNAAGGYKIWKTLPYEGKIALVYEDYLFYANKAHNIYSNRLPEAIRQMESIVGSVGTVTGRAKRAESAANRLQRAVANGFVEEISSTDGAIDNIWDALGTRVTLTSGSAAEVDHVVANLVNSIKKGELEVVAVNSLAGKGGIPYLRESHLTQLKNASIEVGKPMTATPKEYASGYTVGTVFIKYSGNVRGELQIIGGRTLDIANAEHWVYDAFLGKPYDEYLNAFLNSEVRNVARELIERVRKPAESLTEAQRSVYNEYLNSVYINARNLENGLDVGSVTIPVGIPKELSAESLLKTEELLLGIKAGNVSIEDARKYINGNN